VNNERVLTPGLRIVVILGPTATGKTALAIHVAKAFSGEVVSADSRYFYRGMDIGTAKPDGVEQSGIRHHLIDIREPDQAYSLATFLDDAFEAIEDIGHRSKLPVIAGGTPQYLRALLEGWTVPHVAPDEELRAVLDAEPVSHLFERLQKIDPASAARIGPANKRRLIRALEVHQILGRPMSEVSGAAPPPYLVRIIGLFLDRETIYRRIDDRVRSMYASGWLEEVRRLHERGITPDMPAMSAHGYREALEVVRGETDLEHAIQRTCYMIHRYVRHQETWFRRFENVTWFDSSSPNVHDHVLDNIARFLAGPDNVDS
jgi:tRNA dimethylallyltransferase